MNINQQYMLRFNIVKMCIFVVLCVDETYYFICVNSDAIKIPKSYSPPYPAHLVGRGYRLSHFWLAKEVNIEVKNKLQQQCL